MNLVIISMHRLEVICKALNCFGHPGTVQEILRGAMMQYETKSELIEQVADESHMLC